MYCIKCGQELPDNALFCCYCGENIQNNDLEKNDLKGEFQEQELNSEQLINNSDEYKTKKQLAKKAIVALIIVAIILIIGSGIIGFFRNRTVGRYNFNEIFEDYEQNSALASDKYDGKMIELEMCVDSIEKDYVSARKFWYDEYGNYDSFSIWVYFKSAEEIRDISVGDNVVFVGRIDDTPYDNPDMGRVSTIDLLEAKFVCKTDGHGHLMSDQNFEHAKLEKKEFKGNWISNWEGKIYAMVIEPMGADAMPYMASIVEVGANKFWHIPLGFNEDGYFFSDSEDCFSKDEHDERNFIYESSRCLIYSNYGFIIWESEKNGVIAFEEYDGDAGELFSNSLVVEWTTEEELTEEETTEEIIEEDVAQEEPVFVTSLDDYRYLTNDYDSKSSSNVLTINIYDNQTDYGAIGNVSINYASKCLCSEEIYIEPSEEIYGYFSPDQVYQILYYYIDGEKKCLNANPTEEGIHITLFDDSMNEIESFVWKDDTEYFSNRDQFIFLEGTYDNIEYENTLSVYIYEERAGDGAIGKIVRAGDGYTVEMYLVEDQVKLDKLWTDWAFYVNWGKNAIYYYVPIWNEECMIFYEHYPDFTYCSSYAERVG